MPVRDEATPWVDGLTIGEVLRKTATRCADRDALVFPALGLRWSWAELDRRVDRVASALIKLGVKQGEHIGIWSMNCPEWVVIQFAAARIGAVLVNVNPAYRVHEFEGSLLGADVTTLVVGCPFKTSNFVEMVEDVVPEIVASKAGEWRSARLPELRRAIAIGERPGLGWLTWDDLENARVSAEVGDRERRVRHDRRLRHPIHLGHHRLAERGDALTPKYSDERLLHRPTRAIRRARSGVRTRAFLSLFRLRLRDDGLSCLRFRPGRPRAELQRQGDARHDRRGTLHVDLRSAGDVCRATRSSRSFEI